MNEKQTAKEHRDYVVAMIELISILCEENNCSPAELAWSLGFRLRGVEIVN